MQKGFRGLSLFSDQRQVVEQSLILVWLYAWPRVCCMRVRNSGGIGPSVRLGWLEVRAGHRGLTTTALEFEFFIFMRASVGNQPLSNPSHLLHTTGIYATI